MKSSIVLEVCVDSVDSAINALKGGANRLEICANLGVGGGTTPSLGLVKHIQAVCDTKADIMVMVRPRIGDFVYSENEVLVVIADIEQFAKCGVQGVVFGALMPNGTVDLDLTKRLALLASSSGLEVCFHRAFDMTGNQKSALRQLSEIACINRILTSGGAPQAPKAVSALKDLCALRSELLAQEDHLQIMPGSGLNAQTLPSILRELIPLGLREVHLSGGGWYPGESEFRKEEMGMGAGGEHEWSVWKTSEEKVHAARDICDAIWEEMH